MFINTGPDESFNYIVPCLFFFQAELETFALCFYNINENTNQL
jgi:hypothetical protein